MVMATGHLLSTTTFGLPVWAALCWLVIRILRTGNDRLWLVAGLVTGLGLADSDLVAFVVLAIVAGLALPRQPLTSAWFYAGGAVAALAWLPYLVWQAGHGWPQLAVARAIAHGSSGTSAPRWLLLPEQLVLVSVYLAPVWVTGLVRLLRAAELRWCRALGVAYLVLVVVFLVTGGKPYYLGGMFPLLLAAGAGPAVAWMRRGRAGLRRGLAATAVALSLTAIPVTLPVVPVTAVGRTPIVSVNYDAGETIGWPAYVRQIGAVYAALPRAQRSSAIVLASNSGEAGAVDEFGKPDGLPSAYSGHNAYWYWGPPPPRAAPVVAVGFDRRTLAPMCGTLRLAARLSNHLGVGNQEQGAPVWVCAHLRAAWAALWPRLRDLG
jgi:hypothetical protein